MKTLFLVLALALNSPALAAVCSRTITFSDGSVLTAAQLNDELNTAISCINNIDNANIATGANILPAKLSATIAGDGIGRDGTTGILEVNDDNSTLEISGDTVQVKDAGITGAKLATSAADGTNLEVASGSMRIKDLGVTTAKINDSAVTTAKINDGAVTQAKRAALGQQLSASSGEYGTTSVVPSFVDVTNLSVTITTTGRPVFIGTVAAGTGGTGGLGDSYIQGGCFVNFLRGATLVAAFRGIQISEDIPASSFSHIDVVAAGTYTYKVQVAANAFACNFRNAKLLAYEL